MKSLAIILFGITLGYLTAMLLGQEPEEIASSLIITYVGPPGDVKYDTHYLRENMTHFPEIYCEGDFKFHKLIEKNGDVEIICTYNWESQAGKH